ncbi:MAG: transposase [Bdellovibrio sp. CG10_big_fil_rev_8_21_14_0_10_47_8]|nr:MAG: transposase [Bdellovibrio sp. CG10_big_fil_rev_8_21_14_0_10_47_8]
MSGYLRFEAMKYPTDIPDNPQLSQSLLMSSNLRAQFSGQKNRIGLDLTAGKYVDLGGSQFGVNEIYDSYQFNAGNEVSAGRKIEFWSQLDQDWQLGMWQPKGLLDPLRPDDQGLTGVFYKHRQSRWELLMFGSAIFIPSMGPDVKEKNGSLVADSRWYRTPSSSFPLLNKDTKIVYSLDVPDMRELINRPGGGMRLRYGGDQDGLWTSVNAGYKPMNSLLLKYRKNLYLPEQDPQTGEVTVSPAVGYHRLIGGDLGYRHSSGNVALSYLQDQPEGKPADDPYVLQSPSPMRAYSVHADSALSMGWFDQPVGLALNYLRIDGGGIRDYDSLGQDSGAIYDQRFNYTNAASVRTDFSTLIWSKRLMSSLKYMREFDQKGTLINAEISLYPQKALAVILGADIIGVDDTSDGNRDNRFLNQFRANDRVYGGMSYVF